MHEPTQHNSYQLLSGPTNAQFYILCILLFAPTCFGATAFLRELTPFLKYTEKNSVTMINHFKYTGFS